MCKMKNFDEKKVAWENLGRRGQGPRKKERMRDEGEGGVKSDFILLFLI